jgi:hypothetical protein
MSILIMCDECSQLGDPGTVSTLAGAYAALRNRGWLTDPADICTACRARKRQERAAIAAAAAGPRCADEIVAATKTWTCTLPAGHGGDWHDDGSACWPTDQGEATQ